MTHILYKFSRRQVYSDCIKVSRHNWSKKLANEELMITGNKEYIIYAA